ncbi:response regulator [Stenotrophobium rhamnosiphilum]|uniref:DNA-binding response regulator n=1 Tax=Stenotrophobium rhamnosiphilum TaxID=2029166 RepID=A0A2T5MJC4_9GAMM|nr:response regulator transcription factor [Stenotrophobium rhamnosiphilum]PTU32683.1 DNA-binding response regulator [Stenotrophobium rhamnosiphilum]
MKSSQIRILIVDDEAQIRRFLRIALETQGYEVIEAASGREGLSQFAQHPPQLVLLDLGLPDLDGKQVLKDLRSRSNVPVMILSVREDEDEKVAALDAGANDYVAKPFGAAELSARIRAVLRAHNGHQASQPVLRCGDLTIDVSRREVTAAGKAVKLSKKEFEILHLLTHNAGRVLTHSYILHTLWGPEHEHDTQYLRVYVGQLRAKLNDDPAKPHYIANEPGVGYRMLDHAV